MDELKKGSRWESVGVDPFKRTLIEVLDVREGYVSYSMPYAFAGNRWSRPIKQFLDEFKLIEAKTLWQRLTGWMK